MARLVLLHEGQATPYPLTGQEAVMGRHPECDIKLQSNMVSRRHARVFPQGADFQIEDLGSGNGTFVNGQRIEQATTLKQDDRIKLGPLLFRFESAATESAVSSPMPIDSSAAMKKTDDNMRTVDFDDSEDGGTIMGTAANAGGFGLLDVKPDVKLKAIIEISRALAGTIDLDKLLPKILDTLFDIFPHADRGCILLKEETTGQIVPRTFKLRRETDSDNVKLSRTIVNTVLEQRQGILSADAATDSRFEASESISNLTIRSMMCVPLLSTDGEPLGLISIDTQNPISQFQQDDLDLLMAVAGQAALSYETARLIQSYAEKQKQDNEMRIAANVQHALLPESFPELDGYQFFASYEAAQAVGGDYYDVMPLEDGRLCIAFGDVAGKGVPAALVMSRMSSVVRSTLQHVTDVVEAADAINNHMCAKAVEGRFVTFNLILLDPKNNEFSVVNAGHMPPMIRKADGSIEEFAEEIIGVPIGVMEDFPYDSATRKLEPGEIVILYTDGVSEAMDPESELYTVEHLAKIASNGPATATELAKHIRDDVKRHANGREQNDDITLMCFGRV